MTACRAKMVDGSPVTFDLIDHGGIPYRDTGTGRMSTCAPFTSEMVGEGFHVVSVYPDYSLHVQGDRLYADRAALERAGVDTATAERAVSHGTAFYLWEPLFPRPDTSFEMARRHAEGWLAPAPEPGVKLHYVGAEALLSEKAMAAGAAVLKDMVVTRCILRDGRIWFSNPDFVVSAIWRAMEKARK